MTSTTELLALADAEAKQDGPNVHRFRTFKRGTEFVQASVVYPDGETHTFHIPVEAYGPQKPLAVEAQEHIERLTEENQNLIDELHCLYTGMLSLIEKAEKLNPEPALKEPQ